MKNLELTFLIAGAIIMLLWVGFYTIGLKDIKTPFWLIVAWLTSSIIVWSISGKDMTEYQGSRFETPSTPIEIHTALIVTFWIFQLGAIPWFLHKIYTGYQEEKAQKLKK